MNSLILEKQKSQTSFLEKSIIFLLSSFIFIDMLNGVLIENSLLSVSPIFKLFTMILIIIFLSKSVKFIYQFIVFMMLLILYIIIHFYIIKDILITLKGLDWLIKFFTIVLYFAFFTFLIKKKKEKYVYQFLFISFFFLFINFLFGFLGLGYSMYGNGTDYEIGTRGLIFAGNEISAALVICGSTIQMYFIEKKQYFYFFLIGLIMMFMGALLTSKVSILSSILITLIFPLVKASEKFQYLKISKKDFYFSSFILLFIPLISFGVIYYALFVSNLADRLTFFYEKLDLLTLVFSHRNIWAIEAIDIFYHKYNFIEYILGTGQTWFYLISDNKMVEIDLIDFLMSYGILGILISYGFFIYLLIKLFANKQLNPYFGYLLFLVFLIIGMSLTSGHILNSGVAGAIIGATLSLINLKRPNNENTSNL